MATALIRNESGRSQKTTIAKLCLFMAFLLHLRPVFAGAHDILDEVYDAHGTHEEHHTSSAVGRPAHKIKARRVRNGHSRNATVSQPTFYSYLVAFGASYTDNAHSRAHYYNATLRDYYPYSQYGGRYTNGPVAVEYMVNSSTTPALRTDGTRTAVLLDYAYGGSVIQNGLAGTNNSAPSVNVQISWYIQHLDKGLIKPVNGRVLHYFNSGINPVTQIWLHALASNMSRSEVSNAKAAITQNTQAYGSRIRSINSFFSKINVSSSATKVKAADYLIVNIPPLEVIPTFTYQIPAYYNASQRIQALSLLQVLAAQFNSELSSFASSFRTQVKPGSKVIFYDLAALWRTMLSSPRSFGITVSPITATCYNSTTGAVCNHPSKYLYFDTLHPVTSIFKVIASRINAVVNAA